VITGIREVKTEGKGTGVGAVAGGVAGVIIGNQIGGGSGKTLAKIAGAAGGAYIGNKVEKKVRATTTYEVSVNLDNGTTSVVTLEHEPTVGVGAAVRIADGDVIAR
jgi:outer membrane lipoprotein SlyB